MIKIFKKYYLFLLLIIAIIALIPIIILHFKKTDAILAYKQEYEKIMAQAKNNLAFTRDEVMADEKEPIKEENSYFYYQKAFDEIGKNSKGNDIKISQLIKTGNDKPYFYIGDPYQFFDEHYYKKTIQKAQDILWEISKYYESKIDKAIDEKQYDKAYEDMHDWLTFIQKSFKGNKNINNYPSHGESLAYLNRLSLANKTLKNLLNANAVYDDFILKDMENILESHKNIARTIDLRVIAIYPSMGDYQSLQTEFLKQHLLTKEYIQTGNEELLQNMDRDYKKLDSFCERQLSGIKQWNDSCISSIKKSKKSWKQSLEKMRAIKN